ncbi:aldehyde dehydrogenase [Leucobacter sp. Z1108]|uniref:aldehyde dehydrogenase n=1 Tax=Leucobacter sp. Z1108 TaxID=3439066 RepID=UPI003F2C2F27
MNSTFSEPVDWSAAVAHSCTFKTSHFIHGEFTPSLSGKTFASVSPRDGRVLAHIAAGDTGDVDRAVLSARQTFESGVWSRRSPRERKRILFDWADLILSHREELGMLESLEVGKPISHATTNDVNGVVDALRWYAESLDKVYGEVAPIGEEALVTITSEPLGVIAAIVPWNYPMILAALKFAPAMAVGNSIVMKPAEQSSLSMLRIAELAVEAGIPAGTLNVVCGLGAEAGAALSQHMDVDKIVFTGSGPVGRLIQKYAAESNGKAVQIEAGGKSPHVVFEHAGPLDIVAERVAFSLCYNSGQTCSAGTRVLVARSRHEELIEQLRKACSAWIPQDPLDPLSTMGPIASELQLERVTGFIDRAIDSGSELVMGGKRVLLDSGGFYLEPTVFDNVQNHLEIAQEEIFGPVLCVIPFEGFDEGVRLANQTRYGLAASVWSDNLSEGIRASREIRAGMVWVNTYQRSDITFPFGGVKASGHGRDRSLHALAEYSSLKSTWLNL